MIREGQESIYIRYKLKSGTVANRNETFTTALEAVVYKIKCHYEHM